MKILLQSIVLASGAAGSFGAWLGPSSWGVSGPSWAQGPCMSTVYTQFNNNNLNCNAKEVYALNNKARVRQGPTECIRGEYIYVNVSASLHFNAARDDVGIWTATSGCTGGDGSNSCGVVGSTCAVDVLGADDFVTNKIGPYDAKGGVDSCYDIIGNSGYDLEIFDFQPNLKILCDDSRTDKVAPTGSVTMQTCFSWRQPGDTDNCDEKGAYPGAPSKCFCQYIDLEINTTGTLQPITILGTAAPVTSNPSASPTKTPTNRPVTSMPTSSASISGKVWEDSNVNGIQDSGEGALGSVTVKLYNATGQLVATTQTGANGAYSFTGLVPGDYEVEFVAPDRYQFTAWNVGQDDTKDSDVDSTTGKARLTVVSGQSTQVDAGLNYLATVSGRVWDDANVNGIQDGGEAGFNGPVIVKLYDSEGDLVNSTVTNDTGVYSFEGVVPGNYTVEFVVAGNYKFTTPNQGQNDTIDSDVIPLTSRAPLTVVSGEDPQVDAGVNYLATVCGHVWNDTDANGIQDIEEVKFLGPITVNLYNASGHLVGTTPTDANGDYCIEGIVPGDYRLEFITEDGYQFTTQNGNITFTVVSGQDPQVNAGVTILPTLSGRVWDDTNANGIQESGEAGFQGSVTVKLYNATGQLVATTQTDANGAYSFPGVLPGDYEVEFIIPEPFQFTSDIDRNTGKVSLTVAMGGDAQINVGVAEPESAIFSLNTCYPGCGNFSEPGLFIETVERMLGCDATGCDVKLVATQISDCTPCQFVAPVGARRRAQTIKDNDIILLSGTISFNVTAIPLNRTAIQQSLDENLESANNELAANDTQFRFLTLTAPAPTKNPVKPPSLWYPVWYEDTCKNDGNYPQYMELHDYWLYSTPERCCQQHFGWAYEECLNEGQPLKNTNKYFADYDSGSCLRDCDSGFGCEDVPPPINVYDTIGECCASQTWIDPQFCSTRSRGEVSNGWVVDYTNNKCVQDCNPSDEEICLSGLDADPKFLTIYASPQECCQATLNWMELDSCVARSEMQSLYTDKYYADWMNNKCVKDCDPEIDPACGGNRPYSTIALHDTAEACCEAHFFWIETDSCVADSNGIVLPPSNKYFADYASGSCLRDCDSGFGCGDVPPPINVYDTVEECCASQNWIDPLYCTSRSRGTVSNGWVVDYKNEKCAQDCDPSDGPTCLNSADVDPMFLTIYKTSSECCQATLNWKGLDSCVASSEGQVVSSEGSDLWYVDWFEGGRCVKDCVGSAPCGGLKEAWQTGHPSASACCATIPWVSANKCHL